MKHLIPSLGVFVFLVAGCYESLDFPKTNTSGNKLCHWRLPECANEDFDGDGLPNGIDACPTNPNPTKECGTDCKSCIGTNRICSAEGKCVCKGNWDPEQDCSACEAHWLNNNDDCGTCPSNWDPTTGCAACKGNWDAAQNCAVCKTHWTDNGNSCGTCVPDCAGKQCGSDGCGGSCGSCSQLDDVCNLGTCTENGVCVQNPRNESGPCNDNNACTQTDTCQNGVCTGLNPVICTVQGQCHNSGTCNNSTGVCSNPVKTNGTSCNDSNACTQTDTCQSGECTGANPVVCTAQDQCHNAGTCNTSTGDCSNPSKTDGTSCSDGNACTQIDACQSGECTGANPVVCAAQDQCHNAGTCNTSTGVCTNPNRTDGTGCSDGNACTQTDTCQNGTCTGSNPIICTAQDQCHNAGTCNTSTGVCSNPAKPEGADCGTNKICFSEACICAGNWDLASNCTSCKTHWIDSSNNCGTCPSNWDPTQNCSVCKYHWTDSGDDCGTCPGNWDASKNCNLCKYHWIDSGNNCGTCPSNWDPIQNCNICKYHWVDNSNNCGTCLGNWDPTQNCNVCKYHWVDNSNNCGTCPGNWDSSQECNACKPYYIDGDDSCIDFFTLPPRISSSDGHTCAILNNGTIKCWGNNRNGALGYGDISDRGDNPAEMGTNLPVVDLGTGRTAKAIETGAQYTCVLLDNNAVKCWGWNEQGSLGLGDTNDRGDNPNEMGNSLPTVNLGTGRSAKAIVAGGLHTCVLLDNNQVKCWGYNLYGQLGLGDTNNRGNDPDEMGDNLPVVNLGTGRTAKAIALGNVHTCALLDNDLVKCWGYNLDGALGLGDTANRGDNPNEMGDNLPTVDLGIDKSVKSIVGGGLHTCVLLSDNNVMCWGHNLYGELGLGDANNRGDAPNEMGANLPIVDLGIGRTAKAIVLWALHTCALLDNNRAKCWGINRYGELGLEDTNDRGDNSNEMGENLPMVNLGTGRSAKAIVAGGDFSCALLDNDKVKCWGSNENGHLGVGDLTNRGGNPNDMGDNLPMVNVESIP